MADRGKPLAWALREEIRRRAELDQKERAIAREMNLSRNTVAKYRVVASLSQKY